MSMLQKTRSKLSRANLHAALTKPTDASSLAFFRILFGSILLFAQIRFLSKGWVEKLYIEPKFFFKYYGFSWVKTLPENWMYLPWALMILCLVGIILGKWYRACSIGFFLLFCYTELLDLTNYLNHYYFIALIAFMMMLLPMHSAFSLDAKAETKIRSIPRWMLLCFRLQVGLVYFYAGFSKIKVDWLLHAQPMKIWLAGCVNIPVLGSILVMPITAWMFSWAGMLFDISIPFFLLSKKTRLFAFVLIVVFHLLTMRLFYIGMFPIIMMAAALIFFPPEWHRKMLLKLLPFFDKRRGSIVSNQATAKFQKPLSWLFLAYFSWQILMPLRHFLYPGNVLWTEQGYRYSWNVMLMEKDGLAEFWVEDLQTHQRFIEYPKKYLTPLQEKMMNTQPDMILQYAHFLAEQYESQLRHPVAIYADTYVSLNGRPGQAFINPHVDLLGQRDNFENKYWILPEIQCQ